MKKIGRNEPCPCGSGKKYKQCCMQSDETLSSSKRSDTASEKLRVHHIFQLALEHYQAGRLPQAAELCQQILQVEPNHPDALHLLGVISHQRGNSEAAVDLIRKAINARPSEPAYYNNLGAALKEQGKLGEAVACYRHALLIKPDYANAHSNMGAVLKEQGKLDEAISCYRHALLIKPDFAEAHYNTGVALQEQGKLDEAVSCYRNAMLIKPDYAEAHSNLGAALKVQGKLVEAVDSHIRALRISENNETKSGFAQCVKYVSFTHATPDARLLVSRAISEAWGRPRDFLTAAKSLILLDQGIKECIDRTSNAWPRRLSKQELFGTSGLALVADDLLFQRLLENTSINNMELERFLTMTRRVMLESAMAGENSKETGAVRSDGLVEDKTLTFYCALARQCFINEYIYAYTEEELAQVELLRARLVSCLEAKSPVPVIWLAAVAAYFPLTSLPSVDYISLNPALPDSVAALLIQQIREPEVEQNYRTQIPGLTPIDDGVSLLVQEQYEENPYPRWVKVPCAAKVSSVDAYLHQQFPKSPFQPLGKHDEVDVLVAGCGTGQHSIETAQKFRGANVLAVDLSLSSLSYAKRKTDELGLKNIEYAQADVMKLGTIGRTFDIVESVGTIVCLKEPIAGWKILSSLLRPGGFMMIGLYSEMARQDVVAARSYIAEQGYAANAEDIRRCRQELMADGNAGQLKQLLSFSDFFGMSECRDLIFHVQEHRHTIPQIKNNLEELGLNFIGFMLESSIVKQYMERFPEDQAKTNLGNWHLFEVENPNTFRGMYQFWAQKY